MGKNSQSEKAGSRTILTTPVIREFSSGGIVLKNDMWLVRATMPSPLYPKKYWMLPKGWLDDESEGVPGPMASGKIKATEEVLQQNAIREVAEETGIEAKIVKKIGTAKYYFDHPVRGKTLKFATFYLMEYLRDLPEGFDSETSEIRWLPYEEAYKILSFGGEKQIIKKAKELSSHL